MLEMLVKRVTAVWAVTDLGEFIVVSAKSYSRIELTLDALSGRELLLDFFAASDETHDRLLIP
jgi:hypothetical protein